MNSTLSVEERLDKMERLEKLRYHLKGILDYGWDEGRVAEDLELEDVTDFKELKDIIEYEIVNIQYNL